MNYSYLPFILFLCCLVQGQEPSSTEVLERAISFHDPEGNWKSFKGNLAITMETPNNSLRKTDIMLNLPANYFKSTVTKDGYIIESELDRAKCTLKLNGRTSIASKIKDSLKISCERAKMLKNYYTYLYGLPMKLKDSGTILDSTVFKKSFKGKEYLVLKVGYDKQVGSDTWYFYFDPKTYAMEVYQFFHDEQKNDGEYILLSEMIKVNGINMPKIRAWYYNKDDNYLGTDSIEKVSASY